MTSAAFIHFFVYFYILVGFHQILLFPLKNLKDLMDLGRDRKLTRSLLTLNKKTHS